MVAVAQLVESRIVIPVVVGSSPISHPTECVGKSKGYMLRLVTLFSCLIYFSLPCNRCVTQMGKYGAACYKVAMVTER